MFLGEYTVGTVRRRNKPKGKQKNNESRRKEKKIRTPDVYGCGACNEQKGRFDEYDNDRPARCAYAEIYQRA